MPGLPWVYYPAAQQDATKCHLIENVFLPALKSIEVNWSKLRFFSICNCKKLKIRGRKTCTNYYWFLLPLILCLFVARNRHNMQCNAYTHQLSWPHILTRGGAPFPIFWMQNGLRVGMNPVFCAFTSKRKLCSAPLTSYQQFFPVVWKLVLIFYLLTPRSHSLVFLPPVLQVSLFL